MILYFDTETTGLVPGSICQLSYIMQNKESCKARNMFFSVDYVEYGALAVHGLSVPKLEKLSGGKCFADFADEIERDFTAADIVVSHNTAFDFMFMRAEFARTGKDFYVRDSFCTMKKSTPVCKILKRSGAGYKYPSLTELCGYFYLTESDVRAASQELFSGCKGFHDARFDTAAVYLAVNKGVQSEPLYEELKNYL